MRSFRAALLAFGLLVSTAAPAHADFTAFLGATTTPTNRQVSGGAIGSGLLVIAFEFEYSSTTGDLANGAPSLKLGSGNGLLQAPVPIFGFQPYVTAGVGVYRERLGSSTETGIAPNVGGGVKMALLGPLRLRLDYRRFRLGGNAPLLAIVAASTPG